MGGKKSREVRGRLWSPGWRCDTRLVAKCIACNAKDALSSMQALQHGGHRVPRVGAQHHEAAFGHFFGCHSRQQLLQRVLVVVAVHDNSEDAAAKGVHHGLQRLQLRVPGRHDAGRCGVSAVLLLCMRIARRHTPVL